MRLYLISFETPSPSFNHSGGYYLFFCEEPHIADHMHLGNWRDDEIPSTAFKWGNVHKGNV
ncbi:MAG: hypothetical protein EAX95_09295 [Candidatus Thorarchaeota archaeon]|nr:hypothetical protein [Candidatus Thorarchaeota archaeon]